MATSTTALSRNNKLYTTIHLQTLLHRQHKADSLIEAQNWEQQKKEISVNLKISSLHLSGKDNPGLVYHSKPHRPQAALGTVWCRAFGYYWPWDGTIMIRSGWTGQQKESTTTLLPYPETTSMTKRTYGPFVRFHLTMLCNERKLTDALDFILAIDVKKVKRDIQGLTIAAHRNRSPTHLHGQVWEVEERDHPRFKRHVQYLHSASNPYDFRRRLCWNLIVITKQLLWERCLCWFKPARNNLLKQYPWNYQRKTRSSQQSILSLEDALADKRKFRILTNFLPIGTEIEGIDVDFDPLFWPFWTTSKTTWSHSDCWFHRFRWNFLKEKGRFYLPQTTEENFWFGNVHCRFCKKAIIEMLRALLSFLTVGGSYTALRNTSISEEMKTVHAINLGLLDEKLNSKWRYLQQRTIPSAPIFSKVEIIRKSAAEERAEKKAVWSRRI